MSDRRGPAVAAWDGDDSRARAAVVVAWTLPGREVLTPIMVWAAAAWTGALLGWALAPPVAPRGVLGGLVAAVALVVGCAAIARRGRASTAGRGQGGRSAPSTVIATVVVLAVLAGLAHTRATALDQGPLARVARAGGSVSVEATVATEAAVRPDGSAWILATVTTVDGEVGRWRVVVGGLDGSPERRPVVGTRVRASATARPLGHDGFDAALRRRHVGVRLDPIRWEVVGPPTGLLARVEAVRADIRTAAGAGLRGDAAALAVGLVTGDTRGLSEATADGMRATGLTHLVAVSGSNVALVLAVVAALAGGLPAGARRAAMGAAVVVFTVTTRVEPSVLRAAAMAGMVLATRARGVPGSAVHALAATMVVLLVADPASAGSLGLVLSALATAGVLVVAPVVLHRLGRRLPGPLGALLAATLGAQVAVAPVLVATVGEVPLVSVPANLVAVPAAAVASLVAVVAAVVAPLHTGLAAMVFRLADLPLRLVLAVAERSSGPVLSAARPATLLLAGLVVVAVLARRGTRLRRLAMVGVLGTAVVAGGGLPSSGWRAAPPGEVLSVTAIDVGQGDAVLVTTGSGHRMLVDTGGDGTAATWLRRHGIAHVDLLVLTHAHADHVGGLPDVLRTTPPATIWQATGPRVPDGLPATVATAGGPVPVPPTSAPVVEVGTGMVAELGSARVEVVGPPSGWALVGTDGGLNDQSVVLRVAEGDRVALLTGDVEVAGQQWLQAHAPTLRAGLLKVPHHGATTTDPAFLAAVDPTVAVVSVGAGNDYGHPAPDLLGWLADLDVEVHRTDRDGTVTVTVPPTSAPSASSYPRRSLGGHEHPPPARRRRPPATPGYDRPGGAVAGRRRRPVLRRPRRG